MSTLPRIFISHSSEDVQLTTDVKTELSSGGEFELLLDADRLLPGWEWEPFLHEWLARCDAGLLLLTPNAIASDYVLKEATILAWRQSLNAGFPFFVAGDPDSMTPDMIDEHRFSPIGLGRIEQILTLDPAVIAQTVRTGLTGLARKDTPFDRLVEKLAELLADSGSGAIAEVAGNLGVVKEWRPNDDERTRYVECIARHLLCGRLGTYGIDAQPGALGAPSGLNALIGDLADTTDPGDLKTILRILAPHWVAGDAAGKLALLPAHSERRAVGLNGRYVKKYTAKMFLDRGHLNDAVNYGFLGVAGGNAGDWVEHYVTQICDAFTQQPEFDWLDGEPQEDIVDVINQIDATRYVIISPPLPADADLVTLLDRFRTINFVLWTGRSLDVDESLSRVDWAVPPVDEDLEQRTLLDFSQSLTTIRKKQESQ